MTDDDRLRSLDRRFVAAAAPRVARAVDSVRGAVRRSRSTAAGIDLRDLRGLDERYAASGPLGFLREVPQLLAVLAGLVFILGTLVAAHDLEERQSAADQTVETGTGGTAGDPLSNTLGPAVGSAVPAYLAKAAQDLTAAAKSDPDETRLALVSLRTYYRPEQADSILSGYVVDRAWTRAGVAGKEAPELPTDVDGPMLASLRAFYGRMAKGQADAAAQYQELADTSTNDPAFKKDYEKFATLSRKQAAAFRTNCACVFSVVVSATPSQLLSLRSRAGVRAIEVGDKDLVLSEVDVTPLLPEATATVPEPPQLVEAPS